MESMKVEAVDEMEGVEEMEGYEEMENEKEAKAEIHVERQDIQSFMRRQQEHVTQAAQKQVSDVKPRPLDHKAKLIAVYNFKGGVGKTSNVVNIGAALADRGKRVLIVDADPQCNATGLLAPVSVPQGHPSNAHSDVPEVVQLSTHPVSQDGYNGSKICCSAVPQKSVATRIPSECVSAPEIAAGVRSLHALLSPAYGGDFSALEPASSLHKIPHMGERLFLLPGSPNLVSFEGQMSLVRAMQPYAPVYLNAFRKLIDDTCDVWKFDYVLVDLGPSVSTLNQAIITSCDYILPPVFPDYFSMASMHALLHLVLPRFLTDWDEFNTLVRRNQSSKLTALGYVGRANFPKILPFIVTRFTIAGGGKVGQAQGRYVATMSNIPFDGVEGRVRDLYVPDGSKMVVALCKDLHSLHTRAHKEGRAPASVSFEVSGDAKQHRPHALERYGSMASFIIERA